MLPRPEARFRARTFRIGARFPIPAFLCLLLAAATASEPEINLDGTPQAQPRKAFIAEGGAAYSIGSDLGWQPQLGGYLDLPDSWQAGLHARLVSKNAEAYYDFLPQVSVDFRKLWLGDEGSDPVRNSEYFGASLGGFFAYGFNGQKAGFEPLGALSLGKYWMPIDNEPFGLDLSLELSRFFSGHLPGRSELVFITTGLSFFYLLP